MIIRVSSRQSLPDVRVVDENSFSEFHIDADAGITSAELTAALLRTGAGVVDGSHVDPLISIDWIRQQAKGSADKEWNIAFDRMLSYAVEHGWYEDESQSIRAHVEYRAAGKTVGAHAEPGLSPEEFKGAFREHPAGVAVITADDGTGPVGLTATSVFSVSAEPAMLVFSISDISSSSPTIRASKTLVVHLLSARDVGLAQLCATSGIDRFADTSLWDRLPTGEPYFIGATRWIRAEVASTTEAGTSTIMVVRALQAGTGVAGPSDSGSPLVYHNRTWHALGSHSELTLA